MRWSICVLIMLLFGLFGWALEWSYITQSAPKIEYTQKVSLGEREMGEEVKGAIVVSNQGGGDLFLHNIGTSCSCSQLFWQGNLVKELHLPAGKKETLTFSLTIRGKAPGNNAQSIVFQTNDPNNSDCRVMIYYRILNGGFSFSPTALAIGNLQVGEKASYSVDLWDENDPPREVSGVVNTVDRLKIKWHAENNRSGNRTLLGRIEITPNTEREAILDDTVEVFFTDKKIRPIVLNVLGRVRENKK